MRNPSYSQQRGLTLIELMVALVISLLILAGLFTVYQSNQRGYRLNEGLMRTQENGRFAIDFLSRDLRIAAYPANNTEVRKVLFKGSLDNVAVANNPYKSDILALRHGTFELPTADCNDATPGNVDPNLITQGVVPATTLDVYSIGNTGRINNRGRPIFALYCNGNELVEGIENMQVLYGVDTSVPRSTTPNFNPDLIVANQYVTANAVPDLDGDSIPDWFRVVSLRIALLASSVDEQAATASSRSFDLLGTTLGPYNGTITGIAADQKIRRVYTTTVLIRNNIAP